MRTRTRAFAVGAAVVVTKTLRAPTGVQGSPRLASALRDTDLAEILAQRGRAISMVGLYNDPRKNSSYDPATAVPTAHAALAKLAEYT